MEKILVVTVINHPYIMDEVVENFAQMDCVAPGLKVLQKKVMEYYGQYLADGDRDMYFNRILLLQKDVADFSDNIGMHAKFAEKNSSEKEAIDGWQELYRKYSTDSTMIKDLQNAATRLESTFSDNDWMRLKALKKEIFSTVNGMGTKREK
jgi:hypothetical protein